jgi:hypothetical protein
MRLAHREGPLVQPLMREEIVIFQSADLKEKDKARLLAYSIPISAKRFGSTNKHEHINTGETSCFSLSLNS